MVEFKKYTIEYIRVVSGSRPLARTKLAITKEYDGRLFRFPGEIVIHGKDQIDLLTPKGLGLSLESGIGSTLRE